LPLETVVVSLRGAAFSVTVRTTFSGAPASVSASISSVTLTEAPTSPARRDDLIGDMPGIAAGTRRIESDAAVKPLGAAQLVSAGGLAR